jgi:outer membrane lipopolysaccharide assembly protein LptE/RlpB
LYAGTSRKVPDIDITVNANNITVEEAASRSEKSKKYLALRAKNMEDTVAGMAARMQTKPVFQRATKEEIMQSAHAYVFGAANVPEKTKNSKPQQVELTKDPNYEPDDAEMANAEEEEIVADEEEGYIAENLSNKVRISCIPIHTYGRFAN